MATTTIVNRLTPLGLSNVTISDAFWAPRREIVRTHTIPQQERQLSAPGQQLDALTMTWTPGDPDEPHVFWESDVAKWIEAASFSLQTHPNPELDASVDQVIALLEGAQQPDGYLNVYYTLVKPGERFTDLRDAHELYCAGHLMEAAVAHYEATGKTSLLDVMTRYADLIDREFGPGGAAEGGYCGHQEIELALVKLYRVTGTKRYLDLAKRFIDSRGEQPFYFDIERERRGNEGYFGSIFLDRPSRPEHYREYNQSHLPVREQTAAVGHSVRAMYMYSAMTDLAAEFGDAELLETCTRLWESVTNKKMYLSGGLGSDSTIEGFGDNFDLPNADGYAETCAAIGLIMWSQRMALLTGDAAYVDVMERALYNAALGGASADGTCYFYGNPLASDGSVERHEWFGVACCPPNFARLLSSLENYAYSQGPKEAVVNLFVAGSATFTLADGSVTLAQETAYPWEGSTSLTVTSTTSSAPFTLRVRIPTWARQFAVTVNGNPVADVIPVRGYAELTRDWVAGDRVELTLDMTPRRIWAHPDVDAASGRVAVARGPIIYCAEGVDHDTATSRLILPRSAELAVEPFDPLDVDAIVADGLEEKADDQPLYSDDPVHTRPTRLQLVPYFAWANRGPSTMSVWLQETTS